MNTKKILLIEDNEDVRENTAEILELAGFKVLTAPDGKEGVETAKQEFPDLIICDIMMPGLDGYGVLHLWVKTLVLPLFHLSSSQRKPSAAICVKAWRWELMIISPSPLIKLNC